MTDFHVHAVPDVSVPVLPHCDPDAARVAHHEALPAGDSYQ